LPSPSISNAIAKPQTIAFSGKILAVTSVNTVFILEESRLHPFSYNN
jgi:hypothetical protein